MADNFAIIDQSKPDREVTLKSTDTAGVHVLHVNVDTMPAVAVTIGSANIGDAASATQDGVFSLGIRDDALSTLADPEGDLVGTRTDSLGALWVRLSTGTASIGTLAANSGVDIGDVDVLTVPADPFGVNADAASATGSLSAKLRAIATFLAAGATAIAKERGGSPGGTDVGIVPLFRSTDSGTYIDAYVGQAAGNQGLVVQGKFVAGTAIVDANISADYTSAAHSCQGANLWILDVQFADDSAGVLYIQGSQDGTNHWHDIPVADADVRDTVGGVAWTGVTVASGAINIADPGASGSKLSISFENPMPYMRYFFDRTGGSATGLDSQSALQAR